MQKYLLRNTFTKINLTGFKVKNLLHDKEIIQQKQILLGIIYFYSNFVTKHTCINKHSHTHSHTHKYIYIYIYIYCHPETDCFVLSELFSVARHVGRSKPGSKPIQLYVRLSLRPLGQQAYHVG